MRKALQSAGVGAVACGAIGMLFGLVVAIVDPSVTTYLGKLVLLDAAIAAYAGFLIGGLSERARAGGGYLRPVAAVGLSMGAAALLAQFAFDVRRPFALLVWATAGALAGSRRRMLQYSLSTLMALVFILCAALAAFSNGPLARHRIAARAVASGGQVRYEKKAPGWTTDLLGEASRHWFDNVIELQLFDASGADIPRLGRLPHLERLGLGGPELTDRGLRQLAPLNQLQALELHDLPSLGDDSLNCLSELKHLEELRIGGLNISDAGFQQFRRMPQLRKLSLYQSTITDSGFAIIEELTNLEELTLYFTPNLTEASFKSIGRLRNLKVLKVGILKASDAALGHLKSLDKLECLQLPARGITGVGFRELESPGSLRRLALWSGVNDDGLEAIARLSQLKSLEFAGYQVTDDGFAKIEALKNLEYLRVHGASVTDASLEHLRALKELKGLDFYCPSVSKEAVDRLRAEMQLEGEVR